ncbi:DNA repair protein XRCC3 [Portunus trituberculatus]|uniref:DNA repair protein XRCC3 n=1 Tax=Portunus trituberculatus TaxID=210409 RepID=A0A5B7EAF7_PORTR|nr:DNA repair protein XRCC3 [Portunus trituberculatus]
MFGLRVYDAGFVSASSILGASQNELEEKLGLSSFHIKNFTDAVISHVLPKKISAWDMSQTGERDLKHITSGCQNLDSFLGGGLPVRGITEVTGQSGSGKTQDSLVDCVRYQLPSLLSQRPIGLVVLDSVASPFRAEESSMENKNLLYILGYRLHQLAAAYNIAILAINQVTSVIGNNNLYGHSGNVIPTLGLTWANLVTTRLMIGRTDSYVQAEQTEGSKQVNKSSSKTLVEYNMLGNKIFKTQVLTDTIPQCRSSSSPYINVPEKNCIRQVGTSGRMDIKESPNSLQQMVSSSLCLVSRINRSRPSSAQQGKSSQ